MADYTTVQFQDVVLVGASDILVIGGVNPIVLTLNDGGDGLFTDTEQVTDGNTYQYHGSVTVNGTEYPLFERIGVGDFFLFYDNGTDFLPAGFNVGVFSDGLAFTVCFAAGTKISTATGVSDVETLRIGDRILTADGQSAPVKWIGRQTVHKMFSGPRMQPVRIRAGALGNNLPHTDLTVTADHGMIIDDLVINASALVNGTSIDFVPLADLPDRVTYYHIETENHDVILANGAPAETFVDAVTRANFDNYAEYIDLFGAERIIPEMDRPRISSQRLLPQTIRERLGIVVDAVAFGDIAATMTA